MGLPQPIWLSIVVEKKLEGNHRLFNSCAVSTAQELDLPGASVVGWQGARLTRAYNSVSLLTETNHINNLQIKFRFIN